MPILTLGTPNCPFTEPDACRADVALEVTLSTCRTARSLVSLEQSRDVRRLCFLPVVIFAALHASCLAWPRTTFFSDALIEA